MNLIKTKQLTMSSREIAELTGKQHSHVLRDIRHMIYQLYELNPDVDGIDLKGIFSEKRKDNGQIAAYHMDRYHAEILVTGYDIKRRAAVIKRWIDLESQQTPALPQTFAEALQLAADQARQIEQQNEQLAIAAPKAEFVDKYVQADGLKGFREVCKLLGVKEPVFRRFLEAEKIMYRLAGKLTAYAEHIDAGRFSTKTGEKDGHAFSQCKFTPKGVTWISEQWSKKESYYTEVE